MTPRSSARLPTLSWSESLITSSSWAIIRALMAASRSAASGLKQMTNRSSSAIRTSLTLRFPYVLEASVSGQRGDRFRGPDLSFFPMRRVFPVLIS